MTIRDLTITEAKAGTLANVESDVAFRMDEDAFRGFYDRTSRMLWVYLHRLTGNRSLTDDLLQEAYYRFLRAGIAFETESHRRHYLFRIATNLVHDGFRRSQTRPPHVPHDEQTAPDDRAAADSSLDRRLDLTNALSQLRRRERAMLWLAYAQGASHREIAAVVGVKTASVKPLLYRARRKLARLLGRQAETS
jgi:RNA polymerase sigma-70 factor (ECF subfamily)